MKKTKRALVIGFLFLSAELMIVLSHQDESRAFMRMVYQGLWSVTPKPAAGYVPPDRFAPRMN